MRLSLGTSDAWDPRQVMDRRLIDGNRACERRKFFTVDWRPGTIEQGAYRDQLGEVFVEPSLQHGGMIAGANLEFAICIAILQIRDNFPRRDRQSDPHETDDQERREHPSTMRPKWPKTPRRNANGSPVDPRNC